MEFIKKVEQIAYETELKEIMSLKKGAIIFVECYGEELNKACKYAWEKGYIESVSINCDLYGNITTMTFKRL